MTNLIFADSHNMVAYLEKSEDNADFAEVVNFLNAIPISSKSTAWNEIGTNIASAAICLAKKQKFKFSKLIFDALFNDEYDTPSHTKKVFANMRRKGKDFSGTVTPLFPSILAPQVVEGKGSGQPTEPQHIPTTASPSHVEQIPIVASSSQPKKTKKHRKTKRKATKISQSSGPTTLVANETVHEERELVQVVVPCAKKPWEIPLLRLGFLTWRMLLEIQKLKKRVKKLESKKKSRTPQLKMRLFKFQEDSETQGRYGHGIGVNTASISITIASINITTAKPVITASAPLTTAGVSVITAEPSTPPPTTTITTTPIEDEDLTIAQTLMKMKSEKSKAKGVNMQEPSESGTRVRSTPHKLIQKDKEMITSAELVEEARLERGKRSSEIIKSEVDRAVPELAAGSSKRDAEEELDQGKFKRKKTALKAQTS
ncbi:hypothetical protein Tco_0709694 [Tanacetum coccineum]